MVTYWKTGCGSCLSKNETNRDGKWTVVECSLLQCSTESRQRPLQDVKHKKTRVVECSGWFQRDCPWQWMEKPNFFSWAAVVWKEDRLPSLETKIITGKVQDGQAGRGRTEKLLEKRRKKPKPGRRKPKAKALAKTGDKLANSPIRCVAEERFSFPTNVKFKNAVQIQSSKTTMWRKSLPSTLTLLWHSCYQRKCCEMPSNQ